MPRSDDCAHAIRDDARPWRNSVPREGRVGANGIRGWHRPCPLMTVLSLISDGLPNSRFVQLASMSERADTRSLFQTVRLLTNRTSTLTAAAVAGVARSSLRRRVRFGRRVDVPSGARARLAAWRGVKLSGRCAPLPHGHARKPRRSSTPRRDISRADRHRRGAAGATPGTQRRPPDERCAGHQRRAIPSPAQGTPSVTLTGLFRTICKCSPKPSTVGEFAAKPYAPRPTYAAASTSAR